MLRNITSIHKNIVTKLPSLERVRYRESAKKLNCCNLKNKSFKRGYLFHSFFQLDYTMLIESPVTYMIYVYADVMEWWTCVWISVEKDNYMKDLDFKYWNDVLLLLFYIFLLCFKDKKVFLWRYMTINFCVWTY